VAKESEKIIMSNRVGLGIVGAGSIGIRGALDHFCLPDVQDRIKLAAVCDPAPGRAKAAAEKYGVASYQETLDDLLSNDDVHACIICSPIGLHYEQGLKCIEAGKHIHFNKTMTVTSAEATDLITKANAKGLKIVASPGQMLRPSNLRIRKMVQNGDLGKIAWATVGAAFGSYHENESLRTGDDPLTNINPSWYWRKPGGGPMYDMTVYGLHTLTGILGPAKRVTGFSGVGIAEREWKGQKFACDADDNTLLALDFGDNVFAFVYGTFAGSNTEFGQPSFYGSNGAVVGLKHNGQDLDYPGKTEGLNHLQLTDHVKGTVHANMGEMHVFEDSMQLVRWVGEGIPSMVTAEHAAHVIEIIEAGYAASETGQTQVLKTTFTPPDGI
jgi:predicted dehydrogenase